jgi:hypothetical protein
MRRWEKNIKTYAKETGGNGKDVSGERAINGFS